MSTRSRPAFVAAEPPAGWHALTFADRIVAWQRGHGRSGLPWQETRDPYRVWLSEIMLQQTQVSTVLGYYARFLERCPTVRELAAAPADDVLALWSGLGYYARARNLHRCAQVVVDEHGGEFPRTSAALAQLPGIGRSTAAAIAAFCFGERAAILDGNVKRVLARVLAFEGDLATAGAERALWDQATRMLPRACESGEASEVSQVGEEGEEGEEGKQSDAGVAGEGGESCKSAEMPETSGTTRTAEVSEQASRAGSMGAYTQGLMDLGATVCTARAPSCHSCPVSSLCQALANGIQDRYPVKTRKLRRGQRANALLWLRQGDRVWLAPRAGKGVWAGLWSMPEFDDGDEIGRRVATWPGTLEWLAPFRHVLTHFDWTLQPLRLTWHGEPTTAAQEEIDALGPGGRWVTRAELAALGLPAPIRRMLEGS